MKISSKDNYKYLKAVAEYLRKYKSGYSKEAQYYIRDHFFHPESARKTPDLMMQIYAECDMLPEEENWYLGFSKMIGERYGWDYRVLEVGGGFFPAFAKYMDEGQRAHGARGTITTYDPRLVTTKLGGITLKKEEFTRATNIESYDILVGIMPCQLTRLIIDKATEAHKEFFIAMCGCTHFTKQELQERYQGMRNPFYSEWVDEVYDYAYEKAHDEFLVRLEDCSQYSFPYPVVSTKKK